MKSDDKHTDSNLPRLPEEAFFDTFKNWVEAGLAGIPIIGGSVSKIFSVLVKSRIEEKKEEFLRDVAYHIWLLHRNYDEFKPENLKNNDRFIRLIIEITQKAFLTNDVEKKRFLRNAIIQGTLLKDLDEIRIVEFTNSLDWLNYYHFKILRYFNTERFTIIENSTSQIGIKTSANKIEKSKAGGIDYVFDWTTHYPVFSETEDIFAPHYIKVTETYDPHKFSMDDYQFYLKQLMESKFIAFYNSSYIKEYIIDGIAEAIIIQTTKKGDEFIDFISDMDKVK